MYDSIWNQFYNLAHYFTGFVVLFVLYPAIVFPRLNGPRFDQMMANYIHMVLVLMLAGYALSIIKLFELIGLLLTLTILYGYYFLSKNSPIFAHEAITKLKMYFLDYLDGGKSIRTDLSEGGSSLFEKAKTRVYLFLEKKEYIFVTLFLVTLAYSAHLRYYDAYFFAAPNMSDGSVTLAWMKYINLDELFHDGIYPQGFYLYLAILQKFAYIDPVYILKYTGAFNGIMFGVEVYYVMSRMTKKPYIGLFAMFLYGVCVKFLPVEYERQVATNAQELGFIFLLPTTYFLIQYLKTGHRSHLRIAFYGLTIIALVHQVAFVFVIIGCSCAMLTAILILRKDAWPRIKLTLVFGVISGILASLPLSVGLLAGKHVHSTSYEFLVAKINVITFPELTPMSIIALVSIGIVAVYVIAHIRSLKSIFEYVFVLCFSGASFCVYYFAGVVTQNQMVAARFPSLWGLTMLLPVCLAASILGDFLRNAKTERAIHAVLFVALVATTLFYFKPEVIVPYKMQRDSDVEQYLRITQEFEPTMWTIVSQDEGYSLALGKGYHILMRDFLAWYDPTNPNKYLVNQKTKEEYKSPDIFIFYEKKTFRTDFTNLQDNYDKREIDNQQMKVWLAEFQKRHDNMTVYYEEGDSVIYRIHQEPETAEEKKARNRADN